LDRSFDLNPCVYLVQTGINCTELDFRLKEKGGGGASGSGHAIRIAFDP